LEAVIQLSGEARERAFNVTRLKTGRYSPEAAPRPVPSLLEFYQLPFHDTAAAPTVRIDFYFFSVVP